MLISQAPVLPAQESFDPWVGEAWEAGSMTAKLGKKDLSQPHQKKHGNAEKAPFFFTSFGGLGEKKTVRTWNENRYDCASAQAAETNEVEKWRIQNENKSPVSMWGEK